jgi:hypothetical protein
VHYAIYTWAEAHLWREATGRQAPFGGVVAFFAAGVVAVLSSSIAQGFASYCPTV